MSIIISEDVTNFNKQIGKRLEARMSYLQISQCELARRSGVNQTTIHNCIKGKNTPLVYVLYKLASALGVTVDDIICGENKRGCETLIRCKNCKYFMSAERLKGSLQYKEFYDVMGHDGLCTNTETFAYFDDFCSYGKE